MRPWDTSSGRAVQLSAVTHAAAAIEAAAVLGIAMTSCCVLLACMQAAVQAAGCPATPLLTAHWQAIKAH